MSGDKKKKRAVPVWTPHAMPGMLNQTGPSAEAREQLIEAGIWRSDAPNRVVAPRGPLRIETTDPQAASSAAVVQRAKAPASPNVPAEGRPTRPSLHHSAPPPEVSTPQHPDPEVSDRAEQIPMDLEALDRVEQESVVPTPSVQEWRRADATAGVVPTPFVHDRPKQVSVAPTPTPRRRQQKTGVAPTPAPTRRQRPVDATPRPSAENRRRGDSTPSAAPTPSRPRQRRNGATPGKTQAPRRDEDHEAEGRVRRTLRISPQVDRHLHALARLLGLDLNGALSVAIVEHHIYLLNCLDPKDREE
jgi:hypothetical protein